MLSEVSKIPRLSGQAEDHLRDLVALLVDAARRPREVVPSQLVGIHERGAQRLPHRVHAAA